MKKLIVLSFILLFAASQALCLDIDGDSNSAVDVLYGGTNATNAADARTNLGLGTAAVAASNDFEAAGAVATHAGLPDPHEGYVLTTEIGSAVQAYDADIPTVAASQAEMEAGTEAGLRSMSPLRVAQAIAALGGAGVSSFEDLTEGFALSGNGSKIVAVNSGATALEPVSTISLDDSAAQFYNTAAPTKLVKVDASGLTAGETAVIKPVGNYTLTYTTTGTTSVTFPTSGTLATVKAEKLATFAWDGGGSALTAAAGTKRCAFIPAASTLTGLYFSTEAEGTSDITVALFKDAFAAGAHATTAMISGTNAVTIPSAGTVLNVNDTTLTNFTTAISAGDQVCATITATDTTKWLQLTLYGTK